jgi:hypothetical protein
MRLEVASTGSEGQRTMIAAEPLGIGDGYVSGGTFK